MTASTTAGAPAFGRDPAARRTVNRSGAPSERLRVVLCGSFRRDPDALRSTFALLADRFEVLSPLSVDFVDPDATFVLLPHELDQAPADIEQRHIEALCEADFVWLHAPGGHIGVSAMYELGHARALGIPIYSDTLPVEEAFRSIVRIVDDPALVTAPPGEQDPGLGLRGLQNYYDRTAVRRGWGSESAQDTLLLMTEEMGELARAIRKSVGIARDGEWEGQDVAEELADVQLYLVHLATILGVDLAAAVTAKEIVNASRMQARSNVA